MAINSFSFQSYAYPIDPHRFELGSTEIVQDRDSAISKKLHYSHDTNSPREQTNGDDEIHQNPGQRTESNDGKSFVRNTFEKEFELSLWSVLFQ